MVSNQMRNTFLNINIDWIEESVSLYPPSEEFPVTPDLQDEARFLFKTAENDFNDNFPEGLVVCGVEEIPDFLERSDLSRDRVLH